MRARQLLAGFLVILVACGSGPPQTPAAPDAGTAHEGRLFYLTSKAPSGSPVIPADRGVASVVLLATGDTRALSDNVGVSQFPRTFPAELDAMPLIQYRSPLIGPAETTMLIANVATGDLTVSGEAEGPTVGPGGVLAYCHGESREIVISSLQSPDRSAPIRGGNGLYCPPMAWSRDGRLAIFEALFTEESADGPQTSLYVYDTQLALILERRLPPDLWGGISVSWSADGTSIAFESRGEVVVYDLEQDAFRSIARGAHPAYSPTDSSRIAFMVRSDHPIIRVLRNGQVEAEVEVNASESTFSWSPDSEALAVLTWNRLSTFSLRSRESKTVVTANAGEVLLAPVFWLKGSPSQTP